MIIFTASKGVAVAGFLCGAAAARAGTSIATRRTGDRRVNPFMFDPPYSDPSEGRDLDELGSLSRLVVDREHVADVRRVELALVGRRLEAREFVRHEHVAVRLAVDVDRLPESDDLGVVL